MGVYKKIIGGGVAAGLGARYVYNKFNEKSKPSEEDTLVAAKNAKLHKLVNQKNRESGASRSSSSEMNSRAADLAEKSRKARSEYTPGMKKLGNTPDNPAGKPISKPTVSGASRSSSSEMNSRAADLAEKSRKARSEYTPRMKKLGNTPDNPAGKPTVSGTMDKLRSAGSHAKDTAKELYGQFSHSPKAQMIAGGTAAVLGAGLAAKRYLQRKKKK